MRRKCIWLVAGVVLFGLCCAPSATRWHGPVTSHFDGSHFATPDAMQKGSLGTMLGWWLSREHVGWEAVPDAGVGPRPPERVEGDELRVTFINHATVLIQIEQVNVLTDPMYAQRASPVTFAGPERVRAPGISFEDLPTIDSVVISHDHYDHLDVATLQRMQRRWPSMQIIVPLGLKAMLESHGLVQVAELDWWSAIKVGATRITCVPSQHFSGRGLLDLDTTLWSAWVIEGPNAGRAYFAGDTGYGRHFAQVFDRLGPIRLAVLPIGAFRPDFMRPIHMSPAEAVHAAVDLHAGLSVPVHFGTFDLADDGQTEAVDALLRTLESMPAPPVFAVLEFGEGRMVPPIR